MWGKKRNSCDKSQRVNHKASSKGSVGNKQSKKCLAKIREEKKSAYVPF